MGTTDPIAQVGCGGCAVILAGGQSSRMGREKALLEAGGKTLLQRLARTLESRFDPIYVSEGSPRVGPLFRSPREPSLSLSTVPRSPPISSGLSGRKPRGKAARVAFLVGRAASNPRTLSTRQSFFQRYGDGSTRARQPFATSRNCRESTSWTSRTPPPPGKFSVSRLRTLPRSSGI